MTPLSHGHKQILKQLACRPIRPVRGSFTRGCSVCANHVGIHLAVSKPKTNRSASPKASSGGSTQRNSRRRFPLNPVVSRLAYLYCHPLPRRLQRASRRIKLCGGATTYVLELGKALLTPSDVPSHRHIGESPASACRPFLKVETCGILQELLIIPAHDGESSRFRAIACVGRSLAVGFYNAHRCVLSSSVHHQQVIGVVSVPAVM